MCADHCFIFNISLVHKGKKKKSCLSEQMHNRSQKAADQVADSNRRATETKAQTDSAG